MKACQVFNKMKQQQLWIDFYKNELEIENKMFEEMAWNHMICDELKTDFNENNNNNNNNDIPKNNNNHNTHGNDCWDQFVKKQISNEKFQHIS